MSISSLQKSIAAYIRSGVPVCADVVVGTQRFDVRSRLNVYYEAYRLRLIDCLKSDFPALLEALGEEGFDAMACVYIDRYPSTNVSLRYFAQQLSHFLGSEPKFRDRKWSADLAAFEWHLRDAFDAPDCPSLSVTALSAVPAAAWAGMRIRFHPAVRYFASNWNVVAFWRAVKEQVQVPCLQSVECAHWLLWRKDLAVFFRSMDQAEAAALQCAMVGQEFSALCETLCDHLPESAVPSCVAGYMRGWVEAGIVHEIFFAEHEESAED